MTGHSVSLQVPTHPREHKRRTRIGRSRTVSFGSAAYDNSLLDLLSDIASFNRFPEKVQPVESDAVVTTTGLPEEPFEVTIPLC